MRGVPPPIRNIELRDRLSELVREALSEAERGAPLCALRAFFHLLPPQGRREVLHDALIDAVERAFRAVGLRMSPKDAIEELLNSQLLRQRDDGAGMLWVAPGHGLEGELTAAILRTEASCRALETQARRQARSAGEVERAIETAARLFNEGLFFEVHEVLEAVWLKQRELTRPLLQGLIQIAVAFHHLENGNFRGALSLLKEGREKVKDYRPARFGLELARFLEQAAACAHSIEALGKEAFDRFDRRMIPKLHLSE